MDKYLNMSEDSHNNKRSCMFFFQFTMETAQLTEMTLVQDEVTAVHLFSTLHHTHFPSFWRQLLQLESNSVDKNPTFGGISELS